MPPFLFLTLRRLLTLLVLQTRSPPTRRQLLYLHLTRALTFLTMPPGSVALIVTVHLRRVQRTFRILILGLVVSLAAGPGGVGVRAGPTGPMAPGVPSMYR